MVCALGKHNDTRVLFMGCPLSTHSNTLVVLKIWVQHTEGTRTCAWHSYKPTRLYLVTEGDASRNVNKSLGYYYNYVQAINQSLI